MPGGTVLGYVNADHFAVALDLGGSVNPVVRALADQSDFPRAEMLEAALRFVEEDLDLRRSPQASPRDRLPSIPPTAPARSPGGTR